jgi:uncharacterized protein (DUF427 family)
VIEDLKAEARKRGLWNLFLPVKGGLPGNEGAGLTNLQYAPLAEIAGRSPHLAPEALNCAAPDTGNMEILNLYGSERVKREFLAPLLEGEIRSAFSMTEPDSASSDATNISLRIERDGVTLAETTRPRLLFETNIPMRIYIPMADVRMELLEPSDKQTQCPYKGVASYYSVRVGDKVVEDLVWTYPFPIPECPKIEGMLSFFDERVDVWVDGELQSRPETPWSPRR